MKRAAVYVRVSTDKQTTANQLGSLRALAEARGFEPIIYEEIESAVKRRPVFEAMLRDAKNARIRAVFVAALDRLGRNMVGVVNTVLELDRAGCAVVSEREPWLDNSGPARSLLLAIFGWVAEEERRVLIERTHAGLERARKEGKTLGRPRASPTLLQLAEKEIRETGCSVRTAARRATVNERTLRRYLKSRTAAPSAAAAAAEG